MEKRSPRNRARSKTKSVDSPSDLVESSSPWNPLYHGRVVPGSARSSPQAQHAWQPERELATYGQGDYRNESRGHQSQNYRPIQVGPSFLPTNVQYVSSPSCLDQRRGQGNHQIDVNCQGRGNSQAFGVPLSASTSGYQNRRKPSASPNIARNDQTNLSPHGYSGYEGPWPQSAALNVPRAGSTDFSHPVYNRGISHLPHGPSYVSHRDGANDNIGPIFDPARRRRHNDKAHSYQAQRSNYENHVTSPGSSYLYDQDRYKQTKHARMRESMQHTDQPSGHAVSPMQNRVISETIPENFTWSYAPSLGLHSFYGPDITSGRYGSDGLLHLMNPRSNFAAGVSSPPCQNPFSTMKPHASISEGMPEHNRRRIRRHHGRNLDPSLCPGQNPMEARNFPAAEGRRQGPQLSDVSHWKRSRHSTPSPPDQLCRSSKAEQNLLPTDSGHSRERSKPSTKKPKQDRAQSQKSQTSAETTMPKRGRNGPLTPSQRSHAGSVRKVGACDDCRRRKVTVS